jgi:hypothetical protein
MAAIPSNLVGPNFTVNQNSSTQTYFNNYFTKNYSVSSNANDAIVSYFETVTNNAKSAQAVAAAVIYTSVSREIDPMTVLEKFKRLPPGELNGYLTAFLNLNRVPTSLLGVTNQPTVGKYIERCILP